ncbi:MAG: hypothetical protein WDZ80_01075 [Candidatus Paceibacterota bacterium]
MIDSISWQLNKDQFKIDKNHHKFDGKSIKKINGFSSKVFFCKEYRDKLTKKGTYFPLVEISQSMRGNRLDPNSLTIQSSIPKVTHGSNAYETDENDLEAIYQRHIALLNNVGVKTSVNELRQAIIRKADFSKMIILPIYLGEANQTIYKLMGFNYKPSSKFDFMNYQEGEGTFIRFGNGTQKYTVYDKIGEIYAKGYTKTDNKIIKLVDLGEMKRNILKFELSYLRKDSFEKAMRVRINHKKRDFVLEDIISIDLSKNILLKAFDTVFNSIAVGLLSLSEMEENKLWAYLENSELTQNQQQYLFYWVRMATNNGIAGTWEELKRKYSGGSITRKRQEISLALQELGRISGNIPNLIDFLRSEHEKFEIIKPKTEKNRCKPLSSII